MQHKKTKELFYMGTAFIVMTTLKLATMGGLGIALTTGLHFFYDFKPNKKKKGGEEDGVGETLRQKSRFIN
jgi:mannose/fructose/N-acetylgalactosamine-specific phosphotransferase system component IIC